MKSIVLLVSVLFFSTPIFASNPERDATLMDIKSTFGLVPEFFERYPESGIAGAWGEMKTLQLNPKTALSGLEKELIGLAVAAQIPCRYCAYFHTQAAKLNGGSEKQAQEAIAISSIARFWATYFEGMQIDKKEFMKETDKVIEILKERMKPGYKPPALSTLIVTNAETAFQDIERNLGLVPFFVKPFLKNSVTGSWLTIKGVLFNPMTSIPAKTKHLIALGVAAQAPCRHCVYWETEMSKLFGANDQEIAEAVEMAATTRHWSTWLNGNLFDEKKFKKEADKAFAFVKKHAKK